MSSKVLVNGTVMHIRVIIENKMFILYFTPHSTQFSMFPKKTYKFSLLLQDDLHPLLSEVEKVHDGAQNG